MKKSLTLFVLLVLFSFNSSELFSQPTEMLVSLGSLNGSWKGTLQYLDYGDNKSKVTLPTTCEAVFNKSGSDKFLSVKFIFDEGKGRTVTGEDAWTIIDKETFFYDSTNYKITTYTPADFKSESVKDVFVFEKTGEDNGKPCNIQQTFTIQPDSFSIVKRVKYNDAAEYFIRHEFSFERVK